MGIEFESSSGSYRSHDKLFAGKQALHVASFAVPVEIQGP
jgi:hypothetical protein